MLRYAPPIYTVIRRGITFVIFIILIIVFIILYSVISNVSYSRLRIYCLIHTPLSPLVSPLDKLSAPPEGDRPSSIPEGFRETFTVVGVFGVLVEKGKEEPP